VGVKLYLARHTEATHNVASTLNGDPSVDVPLTDLGIEQAHSLSDLLADIKFKVIYISEFPRTRQTADIVNQRHRVPVIVNSLLNDNDTGFEGRSGSEFIEVFEKTPDKWRAVFYDGESLEHARNRAAQFLEELRKTSHPSVLVITHGYIIESIYGILNDLSYEESSAFQPPQGEYVIFDL
jgi:broad specificity phosphatase PhoE